MLLSERARGRWREILPALGVAVKFLQNRHGPCPMCGGKDRFRWDDKEGDGTYFCNQCGAGNGYTLLRKFHGWDGAQATKEIETIVGTDRPKAYVQQAQSDDSRRQDAFQKLLGEATEPRIVEAYLKRRGLDYIPPRLLGHPACPYWDDDAKRVTGRFPTVLAPIHAPDGELVSIQRIYDADVTPRKKTMMPIGTINKAAVRLVPVADEMGIAEGVETAIAAYLLFGIPTWAALSAHGMEVWDPPAGVQRLHIFGDNDTNHEGQAAAYVLARRMGRERKGLEVRVTLPPEAGTDWLDCYTITE